ncbi:MAG: ATP-binding protein [Fibrobacter sp.]|nr:ATP-binding protein [Fibrobacter sp.]
MSEEMITSGAFKIRPAGRHIFTIGRDLIQDPYAAVVELVKNAYDADATHVVLSFKKTDKLEIVIEDNGHGMTRDVVTSKWMVPSTNDKEQRKLSPKGRILQGRKGIGRYASAILGEELFLETISQECHEKTSLLVNWEDFLHADYLSDVDILIETEKNDGDSGTVLTIKGNSISLEEWTLDQFKRLKKELKKLMTPIDDTKQSSDVEFEIILNIAGFGENDVVNEKIEAFPLFGLFDYKIAGCVNADGSGILVYEMQKLRNSVPEKISFNFGGPTNCGDVVFDIRAFDREKEAIEDLIKRGLKDGGGAYVGKLEARRLLNENNGIGVYRNGFRIRPLGDPDFDWLELNKSRVQNPSQKIGSDQVIGFVKIESEEKSCLVEKSARDGLKENAAYKSLVRLTQSVINELETRRFIYRSKAGLSRKTLKVESEFEKLFSFSSLKKKMQNVLDTGNVAGNVSQNIMQVIDESEIEKNKIADSLRETIAIYQGQATLGKIVNIVLHEGRKPLAFFKNQVPLFKNCYDQYLGGDYSKLPKVYEKMNSFATNTDVLVQLFKKIDPLAVGKRFSKSSISLESCLKSVFSVFSSELNDVEWNVYCNVESDVRLLCYEQDVYSIFTNLIENSIFWMNEKRSEIKKIVVEIFVEDNQVEHIDYRDSGPGIEDSLIESEVIFEPDFSTKPKGTGLGLSVAGEAARRCGFELKALSSMEGAYFRLDRKDKEVQDESSFG